MFYQNDVLRVTNTYNHDGRRIKKTLHHSAEAGYDNRSMYFSYLPDGWLQTETEKSSCHEITCHRDYIWLNGKALAQVETLFNNKGELKSQHVYYLHTDHLHTPRIATNADQQVVWRWDPDALGNTGLNQDPDQDGQKVNIRLRFPGQYFDKETGLFYNHHRDYDPKIGRYVQSDPIGLGGGINSYVYAQNDPVNLVDPSGLDVTITLYGGAGGKGHVGIGVNSDITEGFYPHEGANVASIIGGCDVPGDVRIDDGKFLTSITIKTTAAQDALIESFIRNRHNNPGDYNLTNRNCALFVENALSHAGIWQDQGTFVPTAMFLGAVKKFRGNPHPHRAAGNFFDVIMTLTLMDDMSNLIINMKSISYP